MTTKSSLISRQCWDITEKPVFLLLFSSPCVMGLLIGALYNIVDQIFIGNSELGYLGNAATGVSFPMICIANAFAWCIGDGAASYLSICSGRRDSERAHKCVGTGIVLGGQPIFGYNYGAGDERYMEFAKKTFRIYLSLVTVTGLTKMTAVFFQSIGHSMQAVVASLVRDVLCFTPLAIFLSAALERTAPGSGINAILFAAPMADAVAALVILFLTLQFFKSIRSPKA